MESWENTYRTRGVIGSRMHALASRLFPICRSITGDGVRETLGILQEEMMPGLQIHEVPSGTQAFDWEVPKEWTIRDAYVMDSQGERVIDFQKHNLHVVGYSVPVNQEMDLEDLQKHLHSLPDQPDAIPYVTSYYADRWGFCLTHRNREGLQPGRYKVVIDSTLTLGHLTYADLVLQGSSDKEVLLSTYVCHPSMANDNLSGPVVTAYLSQWLASLPSRRYTYRIVFVPETIGSILYISRNLDRLRQMTVAGYVLTCCGDEQAWSFLPSRMGNSMADRTARHVLQYYSPGFREYSFLTRGSDERQYCSPGVDLPVASIMRSKYWTYPEYHTSLDDMEFVTPKGLEDTFWTMRACIEVLEQNQTFLATHLGEPQLGKRGLYPTLSTRGSATSTRVMMNLLVYADGKNDLLDIAETIGVSIEDLYPLAKLLLEHGLIRAVDRIGDP